MFKIVGCLIEQHDLRLVALSACICALGCFTTVTLMGRAEAAGRGQSTRWLLAAALVFGCSVWALHFVAMLAFMPNLSIAYSLRLTGVSVVIAAACASIALLGRRLIAGRLASTLFAGCFLAYGVSGMHYTGVAAMRLAGSTSYDPSYVIASLLVGGIFSAVAMGRARRLSLARRLEVTGWLALSICGMHFTAMAAMTIRPGLQSAQNGDLVMGSAALAFTVATVSLAILVASLVAALMEQHLFQRTLRELDRMRLLSNLAKEGLLIQRDGVILEMNSAGARLLGTTVDAVIGRRLNEFATADSAPVLQRLAHVPANRTSEEVEMRTAGGAVVPVELSSQHIEFQGRPATAMTLVDQTVRKRDEARIRHLAHHDALTDLPNRLLLENRLSCALAAAAPQGAVVAIVYLDLDRFKPVNDLLGHAAGDALLVQVTKRLVAETRPSDTLARVGGDEFVLVVTGTAVSEQASALATRLIDTLRAPFEIEGHRVEIGASIGIALYPRDGLDTETLLRAADTALYRVKEEGRGALRYFEPSMNVQLQARRRTEEELRHAAERGEFRLHFQPLVNGHTFAVETYEALIRWAHPTRGLILPGEFIAVAEQSDLIGRIGTWVLENACEAASGWPHPWRVAVNVSPRQFRQGDLSQIVERALHRHRLDPCRLILEITEGVFIEDAAKAVATLSRLRQLGVRLALDDFGTGYSSLSYLQVFAFDKIKIDRSFVQKLELDTDAFKIIKAIVNLGHNLGLAVTVEGVETVQQASLLQSLACDQLQGYLFGKPGPTPAAVLPAAAIAQAIKRIA